MSDPAELFDAILNGDAKKAEAATQAAIEANVDPSELLQKQMMELLVLMIVVMKQMMLLLILLMMEIVNLMNIVILL